MKNVTISLSEQILQAARKQAAERGVSLQAFLRNLIARGVVSREDGWLLGWFQRLDSTKATSQGWKWSREEVYEDLR